MPRSSQPHTNKKQLPSLKLTLSSFVPKKSNGFFKTIPKFCFGARHLFLERAQAFAVNVAFRVFFLQGGPPKTQVFKWVLIQLLLQVKGLYNPRNTLLGTKNISPESRPFWRWWFFELPQVGYVILSWRVAIDFLRIFYKGTPMAITELHFHQGSALFRPLSLDEAYGRRSKGMQQTWQQGGVNGVSFRFAPALIDARIWPFECWINEHPCCPSWCQLLDFSKLHQAVTERASSSETPEVCWRRRCSTQIFQQIFNRKASPTSTRSNTKWQPQKKQLQQ